MKATIITHHNFQTHSPETTTTRVPLTSEPEMGIENPMKPDRQKIEWLLNEYTQTPITPTAG